MCWRNLRSFTCRLGTSTPPYCRKGLGCHHQVASLPSRDNAPKIVSNVLAWERLAVVSAQSVRSCHNVPAWEKNAGTTSRLGRSSEKCQAVYLRGRRIPFLPKRAILSQGGILCRYGPVSALAWARFSQAGTACTRRQHDLPAWESLHPTSKTASPKAGRCSTQRCASARLGRAPAARRPSPSKPGQCAAKMLHDIPAWEGPAALERKQGQLLHNVLRWERCSRTKSRLGGGRRLPERREGDP